MFLVMKNQHLFNSLKQTSYLLRGKANQLTETNKQTKKKNKQQTDNKRKRESNNHVSKQTTNKKTDRQKCVYYQ